jgi:hypothetical protein
MAIDEKGYERELSSREGLAMIRDAAATGDILEFERVFREIVFQKKGFFESLLEWMRLTSEICNSLNKIIELADKLINAEGATPEEKNWAQGKKDEAIRKKQEVGCPGGLVA